MVTRLYSDLIEQQTTVGRREIEAYYEDNRERFYSAERRRFQIILTPSKLAAEQARQRVLDGGHFARIASEYASATDILVTGVNDVFLEAGARPEFDEAAFSLRAVGDISRPFEIQQGWVIAKLVERALEGYASINEASETIRFTLKQEKKDKRLKELLAKWREEYALEVFEKNLKKVKIEPRPTPTGRGSRK